MLIKSPMLARPLALALRAYPILFAIGILLSPQSALTAENLSETRVHYASWLVYWDSQRASSLRTGEASLQEISAFAWHFSRHRQLVPASPALPDVIRQWKAGKSFTRVLTVVNDVEAKPVAKVKDPEIVHHFLSDARRRRAHVSDLLRLSESVDAIEIDYERIRFEDRDVFTSFIKELSAVLRPRGKKLFVVVQPRTTDQESASMRRTGAATIDWKAIAPFVDRVKVMAYHFHSGSTPPGSIAPMDWVLTLADYAMKQVPAEKLEIVLHLGGFDWTQGSTGKPIEYSQALSRAAAYEAQVLFDPVSQSAHVTYENQGQSHTIWVERSDGLQAKIQSLSARGIRHIGLWRLGTGDPEFWRTLESLK